MNISRLRFTAARQIFETFKTASDDISARPADEEPLDFARKLSQSDRPIEAIAFLAYLLPRREAVWWACQCVRAIEGDAAAGDAALQAAEGWVREPGDSTQRAALEIGASANRRAATSWLAKAAGWSGGNIAAAGWAPVAAPPEMTAKAVSGAIALAIAAAGARDQADWIAVCVEAGIRFANGGEPRPRHIRSANQRRRDS